MSTTHNDSDHTRKLLCDAWGGARAPGFLKFKRDLKAAANCIYLNEDDYSVWQAISDEDQGGNHPNADPLPAQGAGGHPAAVRKRKKRQAKAFAIVYAHIDDERIKELLDALPDTGRRGAEAWQLILDNCDSGTSDLEIKQLKKDWHSMSIEKTVGYSEETITLYHRELSSLNAKLPTNSKFSEHDMTVKLLEDIVFPESLALTAVTELKANAGERRFEKTVNQQQVRDYKQAMDHFDKVWRGLYNQGIIRARAAGKRHDAGALQVEEDDQADEVDRDDDDMPANDDANFVRRGRGGGNFRPRPPFAGRGRGFPRDNNRFRPAPAAPRPAMRPAARPAARPHLCDGCWSLVRNATPEQKQALIQAVLGRTAAAAFLAEEGEEAAAQEVAEQVVEQDAEQVPLMSDDLFEDYVEHVELDESVAEQEPLTRDELYEHSIELDNKDNSITFGEWHAFTSLLDQEYSMADAVLGARLHEHAHESVSHAHESNVLHATPGAWEGGHGLGLAHALYGGEANEAIRFMTQVPPVPDNCLTVNERGTCYNLAIEMSKIDGCDGVGLFTAEETVPKGKFITYMQGQERVSEIEALARIEANGGLDNDWPHDCYIKMPGRMCFWDNEFEGNGHKRDVAVPYWYLMNHAHESIANVEMLVMNPSAPMRAQRLAWRATRDIAVGEELRFAYGSVPQEWDADKAEPRTEPLVLDGKRKRKTVTSALMNNSNKNMWGPYEHKLNGKRKRKTITSTSMNNSNKNMWGPFEHKLTFTLGFCCTAMRDRARAFNAREQARRDRYQENAREDARYRLRVMLERMRHLRRKIRSRVLEIERRLYMGWTSAFAPSRPWRRKPRERSGAPRNTRHGMPANASSVSSGESTDDEAAPVNEEASSAWTVDSGCTVHCVTSVNDLTSITKAGSDRPLRVADKRQVHVTHTGSIRAPVLATTPDGRSVRDTIHLHRVLVVPSFKNRLFSCSAARKLDGMRTVLDGERGQPGHLVLPSGNRLAFTSTSLDSRYQMALFAADNDDGGSSTAQSLLMHRRLAHFSDARLLASGVESHHDPTECAACSVNMKRRAFPSHSKAQRSEAPRATRFGQRINSDLLAMPPSVDGYLYLISFVDEASSEPVIRFLRSKDPREVLKALQSFVAEFAHFMDGGRVGTWHVDNGGEFDHSDIDDFCNTMSTLQSKTVARTPELNGKAERFNGIIIRGVRILLAEANLTEGLWPYAASHVCHIHKRLVSRALNPPMSPYEFNRQRKPNLDKYRVWGCKCYVHIEKEERSSLGLLKTDPTGMTAVHLGYDHLRHGYYVYVPQIKRYTTVRSVTFKEDELISVPELTRHERVLPTDRRRHEEARKRAAVAANTRTHDAVADGTPAHVAAARNIAATQNAPNLANYVSSGRYATAYKVSDEGAVPTPKSYLEAINSEHAEQWIEAMRKDISGKAMNGPRGAWDLVDESVAAKMGRKPLKGKWVFKIKYQPDGYTIAKFKARWVGCGYAQLEHVDYGETFASTIRAVTVRIVLAEAAARDLMLGVIDVTLAFTQSSMNETLFVEQPTGFEVAGKVCRLNMALEGTKQAAHLWQQNLNGFMTTHGFERSLADPCLYILTDGESLMICAVHVDDLLVAYNSSDMYEELWRKFSSRFKATRGEVTNYLGMEVRRDRDAQRITLTQSVYIEKLYAKYLVGQNTKAWTTPIELSREGVARFYSIKPAESDAEKNKMVGKDYNGLMGTLLYAACMTRPDISFITAYLCQFMQSPTVEAWEAALSVACYLNTTKNHGISFCKGQQLCNIDAIQTDKDRLIAFSDASFGRDVRPFCGGFVQWRNGPVSWVCRKAKLVPQSSCEVEVLAVVMVLKEAEFVEQVCKFMLANIERETAAITDNKAAYDVIKYPGATKRTIHFDRWLHFARSLCLMNKVQMFLVGTDDMMADGFTKPPDKTKFLKCRDYLMTST